MKALILGGTGTLGKELTRQLTDRGYSVSVFSRCELKQKEMASYFTGKDVSFRIGDIRDREALSAAMKGIDVVFHCAALKHVDTLEFNPEEGVKTNVIGTMNVADAAVSQGVRYVAFSSTDKAVSPVNAYGMGKALSEKIILNRNRTQNTTLFSVFRWGNVVNSRGSVIPQFAYAISNGRRVKITHPEMTRFWISIESAVCFMIDKYRSADGVMIPPMKAAPVLQVVSAIIAHMKAADTGVEFVGMRPGEKIHEEIELGRSSHSAEQYTHEELKLLVSKAGI